MNSKEALQILNQVCAISKMDRIDHSRVIEAVRILDNLINSIELAKENKKDD